MNLFDLLVDGNETAAQHGKIYGVVIGTVTNNKDPEQGGRVKVKFPWLSKDDESHWARIATLMAGKDRGSFFLPEVDDEVLVAFEHGDVRFPYIIGALWNGKDKSPYDNGDGKNNVRAFKSRSGHQLIFNDNDSEKKELVELRTKAGHRILLDDSAGKEKITIKDKSGNSVEFDAVQNAITIKSQMKLTLSAPTIEIKADTMMTIDGGSMLTIKGTMVKIN